MPPIKRIKVAQLKPDPITTGRGWLLAKIDELEASLKDYVIASGLVLRYHADLLQQQQQQQQTTNEFLARSTQPPKELLERIQQNNYAWIRAELDEYLRLAQTPKQVPDESTLSVTNAKIDPSSSVPSTVAVATTTTTTAPTPIAQSGSETAPRQPISKSQPTGEHVVPTQPSSQQAGSSNLANQSSTPSLASMTPSAPAPDSAPLTVAAAVAAASSASSSSTNDHININNDKDNAVKSNPVLSFNPQNPHFSRSTSTFPTSSTATTTTDEQPSPVPFVTKPRLKPKPRMKASLGTIEMETEGEARATGVGGIRTSSIVDPLLGVVDDNLVQPNMIITPGGGTTRPDGSSTSNLSAFFPQPSQPLQTPSLTAPSAKATALSSSLIPPPPPPPPSSSSAQTQMQTSIPIQGFPQTLTAAEIDQMTSEQAQAIMDQLNAAVSASTSAPTIPPASAPLGQSQPQSQPQQQPMPLPIPPMEGVIDLTSESDEPNMINTNTNTNTNTNANTNVDASANTGSINVEAGDMTDLSEFLNDVDGENWQQILNQFGQS